jgi:hypothetical protein
MIEGLKVTIGTAELQLLCMTQAQCHVNRAEDYRKNLATLEALNVANTSNRPGDEAKEKIKRYEAQAAELDFIAMHLVPNEQYLLDSSDLARLGITQY